nr:MAG TPA: hypothetical protein [Caudoviricetes sp.]
MVVLFSFYPPFTILLYQKFYLKSNLIFRKKNDIIII